jgi:hypothetical protein
MRVNKVKQVELIKQLLTDVERQNFEKWLKTFSPIVNTQSEFELIRKLYQAVLTYVYVNDGDAFTEDILQKSSLFMVNQMYDENKHIQYHMSIINIAIQHKLQNEEVFKEFGLVKDTIWGSVNNIPKILSFNMKESTYEHHYKGLTSVFDITADVVKKESLMSPEIKAIKNTDLELLTDEKLTTYKEWSKKADEYLKDIEQLRRDIIDYI